MAVFSIQLTGGRAKPASREACRRAAVKPRQAACPSRTPAPYGRGVGSRGTAPCASREARCRAAVKPRPSYMSLEQPCAHSAQSGVQGGERKRVPSGHNRRRRLATGSRQPKRGFGTAVPKTTIEVAERRLSALCRSTFPANQLKGAQHRGRGQPEGLPQSEARHQGRPKAD